MYQAIHFLSSTGLRLFGNTLYYIDTIYGLCSVDIVTGEFRHLLAINDVTPPMMSPDDLVVTKDGQTIYITDFSMSADMMNVKKIALSGIYYSLSNASISYYR